MVIFVYIIVCLKDNDIGVEGASLLSDALMTNSTLTKLFLKCIIDK